MDWCLDQIKNLALNPRESSILLGLLERPVAQVDTLRHLIIRLKKPGTEITKQVFSLIHQIYWDNTLNYNIGTICDVVSLLERLPDYPLKSQDIISVHNIPCKLESAFYSAGSIGNVYRQPIFEELSKSTQDIILIAMVRNPRIASTLSSLIQILSECGVKFNDASWHNLLASQYAARHAFAMIESVVCMETLNLSDVLLGNIYEIAIQNQDNNVIAKDD